MSMESRCVDKRWNKWFDSMNRNQILIHKVRVDMGTNIFKVCSLWFYITLLGFMFTYHLAKILCRDIWKVFHLLILGWTP